ncbi:TPA: hypothetical protein HA265_04765 [Candidatus Woesearchaeota archaeon]|nr:hypothetical protein [Candidatus Woesearchaeota archaeon]
MFYSRKLDDTKKLFQAYNVKHVLVDPEMKDGFVWSKPNEGLLFLFTNKETFEKIYDQDGVEIWEVKNSTITDTRV